MKEITIGIDKVLYEEINKKFTNKEIQERAENLVISEFKDTLEIMKKKEEEERKTIYIKVIDENNNVIDGFWFGSDEQKARKKMKNFKKYKKKYKEKYKDKKIVLIIKNEIRDMIIVNNLQENKSKKATSYNIYNVNNTEKHYFKTI